MELYYPNLDCIAILQNKKDIANYLAIWLNIVLFK